MGLDSNLSFWGKVHLVLTIILLIPWLIWVLLKNWRYFFD